VGIYGNNWAYLRITGNRRLQIFSCLFVLWCFVPVLGSTLHTAAKSPRL